MLIVDNFIKDKKLLSTFKADETWMNFPSLNWWDGWWKCKPRNIMELVIEMVWKKYAYFEKEVAGFEYWSNLGGPNSTLGWHVDKDIKFYVENKKHIMPNAGHIYYVESKNVEGGYLEISNLPNSSPPNLEKIEKIQPVENRLIMFNQSQPHRVTKIISGKRRAFLANVWVKKPYTFKEAENVNNKDNYNEVFWPNKLKGYK